MKYLPLFCIQFVLMNFAIHSHAVEIKDFSRVTFKHATVSAELQCVRYSEYSDFLDPPIISFEDSCNVQDLLKEVEATLSSESRSATIHKLIVNGKVYEPRSAGAEDAFLENFGTGSRNWKEGDPTESFEERLAPRPVEFQILYYRFRK